MQSNDIGVVMRLCLISDIHSFHRKLVIPECDVLLVAGDLTFRGELSVIEDFADWTKELPAKHKVVIHGNHEVGHEHGHKRPIGLKMFADAGIIYLQDSNVVIDGIKIHGSPYTPRFYDWEYNVDRDKISKHWDLIPDDTNVLMCHGMPMGILDEVPRGIGQTEHVGDQALLDRIDQLKELKLFVGGHLHPGYGMIERNGVKFVNASSCNNQYKPVNPPIIVDL